jgi:hypothetical protein
MTIFHRTGIPRFHRRADESISMRRSIGDHSHRRRAATIVTTNSR